MGPGDGQELFDPLVVKTQFGGDLWGLVADDVQQAIQPRPVQKGEVNTLGLNVLDERGQVGRLVLFGSADVIGNAPLLQVIKDIGAAVHSARAKRAFFLGEIVEGNVREWDVVEVKIAAKIQTDFDEFREPAPENAAAGDLRGQPAKDAQRLKGRILRIIDEVTPIAMIHRPAPGKNGGNE